MVLNICRYLKRFYTHKEIDNIFLKFNYSLLSMPKILEIGYIVPAENAIETYNQCTYK